jgi:hypothetical protein
VIYFQVFDLIAESRFSEIQPFATGKLCENLTIVPRLSVRSASQNYQPAEQLIGDPDRNADE